jgi:glucose-1-phosphate adenylyltransferase
MNYMKLVQYHLDKKADLTIGALRVDLPDAQQFGVIQVDEDYRVIGFQEKPAEPRAVPGDPKHALASMGIYVFTARFLFEQLCLDATRRGSRHDFGGDVIPSIIDTHPVYVYPFMDENRKDDAYWRDVGTLDAYYEANMDLVSVDPQLNMYDRVWPIRTYQPNLPPPKFVFAEEGLKARRGQALDSIVCSGSIVSGGQVERSILGPDVRINSYAHVEGSIVFGHVDVGRHAKIRRAIIDKGVQIPPGTAIGYDAELDRRRGFTVTESGLTVIAQTDGLEQFLGKSAS